MVNSNLCHISHGFWDMASFLLKNAHFSTPLQSSFNFQFKNVPLGVDGWNFACPSFTHIANYSCKTFSSTTYLLAMVHPLQTDGETYGRIHRWTTTIPIAWSLLKHGRLKTVHIFVSMAVENVFWEVGHSVVFEKAEVTCVCFCCWYRVQKCKIVADKDSPGEYCNEPGWRGMERVGGPTWRLFRQRHQIGGYWSTLRASQKHPVRLPLEAELR